MRSWVIVPDNPGGPDCYSRGNRRLETSTATIASFNGQGLTRMEYLDPHSIPGRVNRVTWGLLAETLGGLLLVGSVLRKVS